MAKVLQTVGKVAKTTLRWIPPFNYALYVFEGQVEDRRRDKNQAFIFGKAFGHMIYAITGGIALTLWGLGSYSTGEINPIKARQVMVQEIEQAKQEREIYQRQISDLSERLFGSNGLADTNRDGKIELSERAEAYKRMGLESQVQFPQPKLEQLERAVQDYQYR